MTDARLKTVETELLGVERHEDVEGWQIPGRYLDFLRIGLVEPLIEVVRHNREDVRSLARLLVHVEGAVRDRAARGRGPGRPRRSRPGLCPRAAPRRRAGLPGRGRGRRARQLEASARRTTRAGGCRTTRPTSAAGARRPPATLVTPRMDSPWTEDRILVERARLLRRLGRFADAAGVWEAIGAGAGPLSAHAWIEVAKLREHRLHDLAGAFVAAERARGRRSTGGGGSDATTRRWTVRSPGGSSASGGASTHAWPPPGRACARRPRRQLSSALRAADMRRRTASRSGTPWSPRSSSTRDAAAAASSRS